MEIKRMRLSDIAPALYNPRKDLKPGDIEYEKIKRSIEEFNCVEPFVWNKRTQRLVGGHQRLKVLKELGIEKIEVSVVDLDEKREKALNLVLNKVQGEWDFTKLADLLVEMDDGEFDMSLTGFDTSEIEKLMTWVAKEEKEEKPEIEFSDELLESSNYVVLYFDNQIDWLSACQTLGIKTEKALDCRKGYERKGVGRIIKGSNVIDRINQQ